MTSDADGGASRRAAGLWLALLAGPVAASLQLSVNYALIKWACAHGGAWVLATLGAIFLLVSLAGVALGARQVRAGEHEGSQLWSAESRRLLALTATGLNALVVVFLLNSLIAIRLLSPCE